MTVLKSIRINRDLSQSEIAKQANISVRAYQNYELGKRKPNVDIALKLAEILNVGISELFGDNGDIPKE